MRAAGGDEKAAKLQGRVEAEVKKLQEQFSVIPTQMAQYKKEFMEAVVENCAEMGLEFTAAQKQRLLGLAS